MKNKRPEELLVEKLIERKETIASMESCTAGYFATTIANVEGASSVLHFSAITYSNDYKIRLGVDKDIIKEYGVYSFETSKQMAKKISFFAESTYGIGITGKINRQDENNPRGDTNLIYISIYNNKRGNYYNIRVKCPDKPRLTCKKLIVNRVLKKMLEIIEE